MRLNLKKESQAHSEYTTKPKHCMVVYAIYPLGETRVQREAEVLLRSGYDVDVICFRREGEPAFDEYKGVKIYRVKDLIPINHSVSSGFSKKLLEYLTFFFPAAFRVTKLHLQKRYATIQVHNLPDFLVFCTLIPKLMGVPILLDLHDLMPEFYIGRTGNRDSLMAKLVRFQERLACKFANHVITVSEHWRKTLIERGVPEKKCSVVMNVADDSIFFPSAQAAHDSDGKKQFRLIYHGTLVERYGMDLAIQAVARLRADIPRIHLTLVGWGDYLSTMHNLIRQLGLEGYVTIDHLRLAEELPFIIRACDLGIVPYRNDVFTDGLVPTKLLEYAAMEMPTVASRTSAIQAYFSESNVEFFEPGNVDDLVRCILHLYQNPKRMTELKNGSKNFNQRYNWVRISGEYVSLVKRLGGVLAES